VSKWILTHEVRGIVWRGNGWRIRHHWRCRVIHRRNRICKMLITHLHVLRLQVSIVTDGLQYTEAWVINIVVKATRAQHPIPGSLLPEPNSYTHPTLIISDETTRRAFDIGEMSFNIFFVIFVYSSIWRREHLFTGSHVGLR